MKMLEDYMAADPNVKPLIFVLSDGETNEGHTLKDIRELVETYRADLYDRIQRRHQGLGEHLQH